MWLLTKIKLLYKALTISHENYPFSLIILIPSLFFWVVMIPICRRGSPESRKVKHLAQRHPASTWWSQDSRGGVWTVESLLCPTIPCYHTTGDPGEENANDGSAWPLADLHYSCPWKLALSFNFICHTVQCSIMGWGNLENPLLLYYNLLVWSESIPHRENRIKKPIIKYQCKPKAQASCLIATSLPAHEMETHRASEGC